MSVVSIFTAEERYHLKNSLYTACKIGDLDSLKNLLAIFTVEDQSEKGSSQSDDVFQSSVNQSDSLLASSVSQEASISLKGEGHHTDDIDQTEKNCVHATDLLPKEKTKNDDVITSIPSIDIVIDQAKGDILSCETPSDKIVDNSKGDNESSGGVGSGDFKENNADSNIDSKVENPVDTISKVEKNNLKLNIGSEHSSPRRSRSSVSNDLMSPLVTLDMLNEPIGDSEITLLHVAAKSGHKQIVKKLLEVGADPTKK